VRLRENNVTVLTRDLRATQDRFNVGDSHAHRRGAGAGAPCRGRGRARSGARQPEDFPRHLRAGRRPSAEQTWWRRGRAAWWPRASARTSEISLRESPSVVSALYPRAGGALQHRPGAGRAAADGAAGDQLRPSASTDTTGLDWSADHLGHRPADGAVLYRRRGCRRACARPRHTHIQRLQEIEQARTETQAQVVTAWAQLQAAQAAVESDNTAVNANRIALAGVREEERVGQRTLLDVLNAEQELLNAEVNLVTDQRNVVVASYTVLVDRRPPHAQDLGVASLVYDAEAHYQDVRHKWLDVNVTHSDAAARCWKPPRRPDHLPAK